MTNVNSIHTVTGKTAVLPKRIVDHPILGEFLVEVNDDAKPYADGLFKPTTAEGFESVTRRSRKKKDEPVEDATEPEATGWFGTQNDEDN